MPNIKGNPAFLRFDDYQKEATKLAIYPEEVALAYTALGLTGEAGEVADKVKKIYRDKAGVLSEEDREEIAKELGDVLWYLANVAEELNADLSVIAQMNLTKLWDRQSRNKLQGEGDNR